MEAVLEHVFVLSFPSLGQYKTILSKHQLTVETGSKRVWSKSDTSIGWKGKEASDPYLHQKKSRH